MPNYTNKVKLKLKPSSTCFTTISIFFAVASSAIFFLDCGRLVYNNCRIKKIRHLTMNTDCFEYTLSCHFCNVNTLDMQKPAFNLCKV